MNPVESLKQLERRAYRSTFQDGIYDIQFGLLFIILAWIPLLEAVGVSRFIGYGLLAIPFILLWLGKRYVTIPRLGAVEFGARRKTRSKLLLLIGAGVVVLMLPLIIMIIGQGISGPEGWMLVAAMALPVFVLGVYFLDFPRLYIYAAVLIAGVLQAEFLAAYVPTPFNSLISFGLPGVIIFLVGLSFLARFIRKYPRSNQEAPNVS